ncbi:DUF2339 domain-containing protein [Antarcticibacterium sp. 1MA-6-2]|uniref:DUF2339 domain-containing protein n=1 Tax=Antarcticibacterium sp. 1MA-6-2 TaxID=2908210 RepID=UPI001F25060C|nr:DUF2339 domain-containing protein [Antarcticibacterium sp. 1MA-6-2]UJH92158.1 DUF2339 domain-containing protein [Antarcticibacterium sp. 1MA-6-2]
MANHPGIEELLERLELLQKKQNEFSREINELKKEIYNLGKKPSIESSEEIYVKPEGLKNSPEEAEVATQAFSAIETPPKPTINIPKKRSDLEKFIGENLINKIGIIITILGIAIGAKYSIENNLISPLTRIILGYLSGAALLGFGLKFKKSYENYSAVLVSGAIAIMYFITYAAYGFYALFPQALAFGLMLVFTALTVFSAFSYNRQVIAHIGMVGAYAIPFLLSNGSGRAEILFMYMAIINVGILVISFKKYWKSLLYAAFVFTWLIFMMWLFESYTSSDFILALGFGFIFFGIFYLTFLGYRLMHKENYNFGDVVLLLSNSFIFYAIGYYLLSDTIGKDQFLGIFTVTNSALHAMVAYLIFRRKESDRSLFYLISGLAIVFFTISIPVQLESNWVTLLWSLEAAVLFWIGRTRKAEVYEKISYAVMLFAFVSLIEDWSTFYRVTNSEEFIAPLINNGFLTSVLFLIAFGFITWLNRKTKGLNFPASFSEFGNVLSYSIPGVFIFCLYYSFRLEIEFYWQQLYMASAKEIIPTDGMGVVEYYNFDLLSFQSIWIINYSLFFLAALTFINIRKFKNYKSGIVLVIFSVITLLVFLTQGLISLADLRESHFKQTMAEYYTTGEFHFWIRYISIAFALLLLVLTYKLLRQDFMKKNFSTAFEIFLHLCIISIASSELFLWIDAKNPGNSFKLGLSILWGVYSLLLIGLGIQQNKKYLRVAAMILFGGTLVKLFFYDISNLDTISKTIVFVCLGILLLIISFLYNKYKNKISV